MSEVGAWKRNIMSPTEKKPDICAEERCAAKAGDEVNQPNLPASTQTHLAWMRTRMSLENALASWVRTATSLIVFGFAIVQFFEHFNEERGRTGQHLALYVGLVLIGIGSLATAVAVWDYHKAVKYLESDAFRGVAGVPGIRRVYPVVVVAVLLCLIGLLAFFTILFGAELPWPGRS
jgi:putative membrane protein